jgi:hypothetical protein
VECLRAIDPESVLATVADALAGTGETRVVLP